MSTPAVQSTGPDARPNLPGLTWGIKRSFTSYIVGLADGRYSATDGASLTGENRFNFVPGAGSNFDARTGRGILKFRGTVRLSGHFNILSVTVADPWIEFHQDHALLTIPGTGRGRGLRVPLALLAASPPDGDGEWLVWETIPASLTAECLPVFENRYAEGEELDPVRLALPRG